MSPLVLFSRPRLAPHVRLQVDPIDGTPMLLYPEGFLGFQTATGLAIVELCDGQRTVKEILALLAEEYEAPPEEISADVDELLQHLVERNFIILQP